MSLDATLARVSALQTAFDRPTVQPVQAATATGASPAGTSTATGAGAGSGGATFATQLQGAMASSPVSQPATTGGGAADMVQIAEGEVGQAEQPPGSNDSARIALYRTATQGAQSGEPWCAYFVSWVAKQAGIPFGARGQGFGYVGDIWNWAQQTGRAIPNGPGVVPTQGDLIVFGDHHVGLVAKVLPDGSIQTIEGNYSDKVSRVVRGASEATGYVRMG